MYNEGKIKRFYIIVVFNPYYKSFTLADLLNRRPNPDVHAGTTYAHDGNSSFIFLITLCIGMRLFEQLTELEWSEQRGNSFVPG